MIEFHLSKGAVHLAQEAGFEFDKEGPKSLELEDAMTLEQLMWVAYKRFGKTAEGRAASALSRQLATLIEQTRSIQEVEREVRTVLTNKWDDQDAVETHIQLMVHRGWDRAEAMKVIHRVRSS